MTSDDLLLVEHLDVDGPAGPVFRFGAFSVPRSRLTVLWGPSGAGRSSALLAVCGRLRGVRGCAQFDGQDLVRAAKRVRSRSAVARITGLVDLEPRLRVEESITERALTEGVSTASADRAVARIERRLDLRIERRALVETLSSLERSVLTLALAERHHQGV